MVKTHPCWWGLGEHMVKTRPCLGEHMVKTHQFRWGLGEYMVTCSWGFYGDPWWFRVKTYPCWWGLGEYMVTLVGGHGEDLPLLVGFRVCWWEWSRCANDIWKLFCQVFLFQLRTKVT